MRKPIQKKVFYVGELLIVFVICFCFAGGIKQIKEEHEPEEPDAVSSTSINQDEHLTIVANSDTIPDKEAFARKVIHMCQDNSFRSIMFSTDVKGYPARLDITVYFWQEDIGEKEPVCHIEYVPLEYNEDYDIKNDQEQFHLYVDDEEIEFY